MMHATAKTTPKHASIVYTINRAMGIVISNAAMVTPTGRRDKGRFVLTVTLRNSKIILFYIYVIVFTCDQNQFINISLT